MKIRGLSATGIKDFLQCQLKVVFRYDHDIPSMKNDHMKIGIAVHNALEQFVKRMMKKQSFPDAGDYDFAIATFMNSATEEGLEAMSFYEDGKRMVTEFIDRYDPSEEVLSVEGFFTLTTPDGVPIVGAIDKVVKVNDDTIAIIDYKTARNAMTTWDLADDVQLSMYDLAASIMWPEYKNRLLFLDYVRIDKRVSTYRTDEDRETFNEFLNSTWLQMQKLEEEEVKGRLNQLCGWCDYKSYCPTYAGFMKTKATEMDPLPDMKDGDFLEHWENVAVKKSILENRQRELKMIATKKFMEGHDIAANGKELYSTQASRTNYAIEKVVEIIPEEDLYGVLAVNKAKLDRYAKDDPDMRSRLQRIAEVNYNAPVYKTRAVREELNDSQFSEDESAA
jgi:putative RecB family exonuclease